MEDSSFKSLPTGIQTLDDLLAPPVDAASTPSREPGFAYIPHAGFCGVIFGASNSGKSILSLQLACRFVSKDTSRFAIFISQENLETVRRRVQHSFGFLNPDCDCLSESLDDLDPDKTSKLVLIHMPLDAKEQQQRLIDTFELINSRFCCNEKSKWGGPADDKERILIVVDNAETIRTEAYLHLIRASDDAKLDTRTDSGRREFCKLLRDYCARHRIKAWFTFEESGAQGNMDELPRVSTAAETYAADAAIRLGMTVMDGNFRERSLEVIKARDQFYRRGPHHFSIRGLRSGGFGGPSATDDPTQTGIIVYPSLPTQLHRLSREGTGNVNAPGGTRWLLGIKPIDEAIMLLNPITDGGGNGFLARGTVSVLVADLDSMGTDLALHFAVQGSGNPDDDMHWLYISLHHVPHMLGKIANRYKQTKPCVKAMQNLTQMPATPLGSARCLFFPPEQISESKLLHDIDTQMVALHALNKQKPLRIVVDDIFALDKRFNLLRDKDDFIAALFELFRRRGATVLVVDTVEVGEGRNPLERSVAAGMADHVFLLRHIEFQTKTRKVFSVLKLAEFDEPSLYWELDKHGDRINADSERFQFFKGLLSGKPEPVQITLSLYADSPGSPQHKHLKTQQEILSKAYGQHIEIHACHPDAYVALQQTIRHKGLPVLGDCHIISVDEIWLNELISRDSSRLRMFDDESWDKTPWISCAQDMARECNGIHFPESGHAHFAIPDRHNCGLLAYYPLLRTKVATQDEKALIDKFFANPSWEDIAELQKRFVSTRQHGFEKQHSSARYRDREPEPRKDKDVSEAHSVFGLECKNDSWGIFTFSMENHESCVSFLFELVLSLTDKDEIINPDGNLVMTMADGKPWSAWTEAIILMMRLLDPWDIHRLADGWLRPCEQERPCLFSRQWFTSWGALGLRFSGLQIMELPPDINRQPVTVSGTWYLAMLEESTAVSAGKALIRRLASSEDELHRLNYGIGLPVRETIYKDYADGRNSHVMPHLPYAKQFAAASKVNDLRKRTQPDKPLHDYYRKEKCPFHRPAIRNYKSISPILMGLISKCAGDTVAETANWFVTRKSEFPPKLKEVFADNIMRAAEHCAIVQRESPEKQETDYSV